LFFSREVVRNYDCDWENALQEMLSGSSFGVLKLGEEEKFVL